MSQEIQTNIESLFIQKGLAFPDCWQYSKNDYGIFFLEKNTNKKRYGNLNNCEYCNRIFATRKVDGNKFCSSFCGSFSKVTQVELNCAWCNKIIKKVPSKLKNSKHGKFFCNRICKEKAQSIDGGLKDIQPDHYKDGISTYNARAFRVYGHKCVDCNITFKPFLEVHHKDGNRKNGNIDNLEIVCLLHHYTRHMKYNNLAKRWEIDFKQLTSKEDLENILRMCME